KHSNTNFRRNLLSEVSILALLGYVCTVPNAMAASDQENRPTVWIELGTQLERADTEQTIFAPGFFDLASPADLGVMTDAQRPSRYSIGGEGKISLEPEGTHWVFSAAVRYGRSNSARHLHHETAGLPVEYWTLGGAPFLQYTPNPREFGDGQSTARESHLILDFLAGKDVGLGLFGSHGHSTIQAGVRFAQFVSKADTTLHARPVNFPTQKYSADKYNGYFQHQRTYTAVFHAERSTHAIGPSISWDSSAVLAGSDNDAQVSLDWGVNAAILFGRQRAKTRHQTNGLYRTGITQGNVISSYAFHRTNPQRSRSVTIPNIGGFAGVSVRFPNAKVSLGYRGDFFFNAIDTGIDTHRSADQKFYGPFANISIGLGG